PGRSHATSATIPAFTTSRKNPSVKTVIGSVSRMAIGRTMALTTPSRRPARTNVVASSMRMPDTHRVAIQRPIPPIRPHTTKPVMLPPLFAQLPFHQPLQPGHGRLPPHPQPLVLRIPIDGGGDTRAEQPHDCTGRHRVQDEVVDERIVARRQLLGREIDQP